jgi:modulator of FtsH protease HflK
MKNRTGWLNRAGAWMNEAPKSPWGSGSNGGGDDKGSGSGPRNPWSFPPEGRRPRSGGSGGQFDDWLQRARRGGGNLPPALAGGRLWVLILGALLVIWVIFTSFHVIGPKERGVVTTLGRYSGTLDPGVRMTFPAPLQMVRVEDVTTIQQEKFPESGENRMLTGDQNVVDLAYQVNWNIDNVADYAFQIARPKDTVRATAESAMRAVIATTTLNDAIGSGKDRMEAQVQQGMQEILDQYHAGIRIQSVAIQRAAAPAAVDEAFKAVSAAQQEAQASKNNANAYAEQVIAAAEGESAEFDKIYEQYRLAPEVTRRRIYYETMEQVLARTNKTIVEAPGVTPYLPLPGVRAGGARAAEQPQPAQGAQK